jgi:hypothetical protein
MRIVELLEHPNIIKVCSSISMKLTSNCAAAAGRCKVIRKLCSDSKQASACVCAVWMLARLFVQVGMGVAADLHELQRDYSDAAAREPQVTVASVLW